MGLCSGGKAIKFVLHAPTSAPSHVYYIVTRLASASTFYVQCWCGDESTDYTMNGESDLCNIGCTGNGATVCGGFFAMSVWENN